MATVPHVQARYGDDSRELPGANLAAKIAALVAAPTRPQRIILAQGATETLSGDTTIPAGVTLDPKGGVIATNGHTLTISGAFVDPGAVQVFDTSGGGSVAFAVGKVGKLRPEWWGAKADDATDSAAALLACSTAAQAIHAEVELMDGIYRYGSKPFAATDRLTITGKGKGATILKPLSGYTGYAISVTDCWRNSVEQSTGTTIDLAASTGRVILRGFSILGDTATRACGIDLAGVVDFITIDGVDLLYLSGTALRIGVTLSSNHAVTRESRFSNLRVSNCGREASDEAAIEIDCNSTGSSDGTNQLRFLDCDVLYNNWTAIRLRNSSAVETVRRIIFDSLMLHGHGTGANATASHLMQIIGRQQDVQIKGLRANGSHDVGGTMYAVVHIDDDGAGGVPQMVSIEGNITSCSGHGVQIDGVLSCTISGTCSPDAILGNELIVSASSISNGGHVEYNMKAPTTTRTVSIDATEVDQVTGSWDNDLHYSGGYRSTVDGWYYDNVPASLATTAMTRLVSTAEQGAWIAPRDGSVTTVTAWSSLACTAGNCFVKVWKSSDNGATWAILLDAAAGQMVAALTTTDTRFGYRVRSAGQATFLRGDLLRLEISTDASWLPVTADVRGAIEVET